MTHVLDEEGFQIVPSVLTQREVQFFRTALDSLQIVAGHRNLMRGVPDIAALAVSSNILGMLTGLIGGAPFPVRSIFFDKTPRANWLVPWHQDLSIAVKGRMDLPGYGPWSMKDGVAHVQPPIDVLESMLTLRLHLDDCDESNGALRVIPRSHRLGRLDAARITEIRSTVKERICSLQTGDALLMRPLLLHSSPAALAPVHRRVIHLEYADCPLAKGLTWAEAPAG